MRYAFFSLVAVILGVALGLMTTKAEMSRHPEVLPPMSYDSFEWIKSRGATQLSEQSDVVAGEHPRVEVEGGELFDFGNLEQGESSEHTFVLKNVGKQPLSIEKGKTTCKCIMSDLDSGPLLPGATREVTLKWTAKVNTDFEDTYEQSAEIATNDPDRPMVRLRVKGKVSQTIESSPPTVMFGSFTTETPVVRTVSVLFNRRGNYTIEQPYIADADWREHFDISFEPIEPPPGREGSRYLVTVKTKPSMPRGRVQQTLKIKTSYANIPEIEIPIEGTVQGDIVVSGSKIGANGDLRMGPIPSTKGANALVLLTARGEWVPKLEVSVAECFPSEAVKVEIKEPASRTGATALWTIRLTIPPGTMPIDKLGPTHENMGRLVIKTNHPEMSEVVVPLSFAVVDDAAASAE